MREPEGSGRRSSFMSKQCDSRLRTNLRPRRAGALLSTLLLSGSAALGQGGPPPTLVVTAPVELQPIAEEVELAGSVFPLLESTIASEVDGLVEARVVEHGQLVRQGDPLVRLDPRRLQRELESARAQKAEVEARLQLASAKERRSRELIRQEIVSATSLEEDVAQRAVLESQKQQIETRLAAIEDDIGRTVIRAAFSGVVTELRTEAGQWLGRGDPVARLVNLDHVEIRLDVPERYYRFLRPGDAVKSTIDALGSLELDGKVFAVVPSANASTRTFPVLIRAGNPERRVAAGMLARVKMTLSTSQDALQVHKDAIVRLPQGQVVYVLDGDTVRAVSVQIGRASGERVEVLGELEPGQNVVVRGNERLMPGQKVRTGEPGAAPGS
jgi:RND family efflux transporter MFP subunit